MDLAQILQSLPADVALRLQLLLEDCALSKHLLQEEVLEIIAAVVQRVVSDLHPTEEVQQLLARVPDAVARKIYG
jgi:hypothetical protein